jgi:hypothetical protein
MSEPVAMFDLVVAHLECHAAACSECALDAEYHVGTYSREPDPSAAGRHAERAAAYRAAAEVLRDMARPAIRRAA